MNTHTIPPAASGTRSAVNKSLTRKAHRNVVENPEYAAFIRRILRAYSRRIASGDIEALTDLTTLQTELDTALTSAVTGLREQGYSWTDIARPLGVTRQAAQQRFGGTS
jgi:hypothetical protein